MSMSQEGLISFLSLKTFQYPVTEPFTFTITLHMKFSLENTPQLPYLLHFFKAENELAKNRSIYIQKCYSRYVVLNSVSKKRNQLHAYTTKPNARIKPQNSHVMAAVITPGISLS